MPTENKERSDLVRRLELSPGDVTLGLDQKVIFAVLAYDKNDRVLVGIRPTWRALHTADKKKAVITQDGMFIASQPGEVTIIAKVGRTRAQATVVVKEGTRRDPNLKPFETKEVSSTNTKVLAMPRFPTMIPMAARATNWELITWTVPSCQKKGRRPGRSPLTAAIA